MKTTIISTLILTAIIASSPSQAWSQQTDPATEIRKVIGDFFSAITARDALAVSNVTGKGFVAMDTVMAAGKMNARIEFLDASNSQKLLPPEGNTDMANLRVASLRAEFSDSNPTLATASFVATQAPFPSDGRDTRQENANVG